MIFSMFSCSHILSIIKPNAMSKRAQERRTGEELVEVKSRHSEFDIIKFDRESVFRCWTSGYIVQSRRIADLDGILISQAL